MLAEFGQSPHPRSRGIFDSTSGRFVDSVTRKPVGEINTEEYLERLRMVHCQEFGTKPKTKRSSIQNIGSQPTEGSAAPAPTKSNSDTCTTEWGSYQPYYSDTAVTPQEDHTEDVPTAEQQKAPVVAEQKKDASEAELKKEDTEDEQKKQRKDAREAEWEEAVKRNKRWYDFIFKKEYKNDPIWYRYRKSKSLWDGIFLRTHDQFSGRPLLTDSTPSATGMSKSLPTMTSRSREDCMEGIRFQDYPEKVKMDKQKYIWQNLLCCCRQQING